ncbi:MAG TPA: KTSC domain-containing protein [Leptospiraceae bacterium]|nr:KTSC domain-containing protein [Leptospiraceae bacterium]
MSMIDILTTEKLDSESSKLLTKAEYSQLYHQLTIWFKTTGKAYLYKGVPEETWEEFKNSESKGKYFHAYIKGLYKCEKLEE